MLYNGIMIRTTNDDMKDYFKGQDVCRREALLKHFGGNISVKPSGHMCCDRCAETCTCKGKYCDMDVYLPVGQLYNDMDVAINSRQVAENQLEQLRARLWQMQKAMVLGEGSRGISHVTYQLL